MNGQVISLGKNDNGFRQWPVTQHSLQLGAQMLEYQACFSELTLYNQDVPATTISATSYTLVKTSDQPQRPVMFLFNGGPGASSLPLHFKAIGPRLITTTGEDGYELRDNPNCLLDIVDLVFIDPVGTGFNRNFEESGSQLFLNVEDDAQSVLDLITRWLEENNRAEAPVYLCGQSYGAFRLTAVVARAHNLNLAGLTLISPMIDPSGAEFAVGNDRPYIGLLPSMAACAHYHGRSKFPATTVTQLIEESVVFAQGEYASALQLGSRLSPLVGETIAQRLSDLLGLPAELIKQHNLRIDLPLFMDQLLDDADKRIGQLDGRIIGPKHVHSRQTTQGEQPTSDPALVISTMSLTVARYFQEELHTPIDRPYVSLNMKVNAQWDWRAGLPSTNFYVTGARHLTKAMQEHPALRLQCLSGYYDLSTPYLATRYVLEHAGLPEARLDIRGFPAGHTLYTDHEAFEAVTDHLRMFFAQPSDAASTEKP